MYAASCKPTVVWQQTAGTLRVKPTVAHRIHEENNDKRGVSAKGEGWASGSRPHHASRNALNRQNHGGVCSFPRIRCRHAAFHSVAKTLLGKVRYESMCPVCSDTYAMKIIYRAVVARKKRL